MLLTNNKFLNFQINIVTLILIAIIIIGGTISYNMYIGKDVDLKIARQNQSALNDTIRVSKNKLSKIVYSKEIFVAETNKELKKLNANLNNTLKEYNGKIHELTVLTSKIKIDIEQLAESGEIIETPEGNQTYDWDLSVKYDDFNYRILKGKNTFRYDKENNKFESLPTIITYDEINFKLVQGLRTSDDGKIEMFVSSNYPNFNATNFESVIIDPKTHPVLKEFTKIKRWDFRLYGGYGVTNNLSSGIISTGPQIGFGLTYKPW